MQYTNLSLALLGCAGILLHSLKRIAELKKAQTFKIWEYFGAEWPALLTSFIVVIIALVLKGEIIELDAAGKYLGFGFLCIGYMGQSLLVTVLGKAEKKIGILNGDKSTDKEDEKP